MDQEHSSNHSLQHKTEACESDDCVPFYKKPLYFWLKSFADKEIHKEQNFSNFIRSNALSNALEYIGLVSENEQSSLHLSAIFDEESHFQSLRKYPNHYESEVKSRIQSLNRIFVEIKSLYEDNFSQIISIRPPNTVHISSNCEKCSIQEFEKLLVLLLGAAIQGSQKQDTIRKIKKFPTEMQESLINCIKKNADNAEIINIKSWSEFSCLDQIEQQKIYEGFVSTIRRIIMERNELIQNQLMADYFAGMMNCLQKRIYEGKGFGPETDYDENRSSTRILREELHEKSELLSECREELELAKSRIQELEFSLSEKQHKLQSCKKVRDEMDEMEEKTIRLENELSKMKVRLENSEKYYEQYEIIQDENKALHLKNDLLVDQLSFLEVEKSSRIDDSELLDLDASFRKKDFELNQGFIKSTILDDSNDDLDLDVENIKKEDHKPSNKVTIETQTEEIIVISKQESEIVINNSLPEPEQSQCSANANATTTAPVENKTKRQRRRSNTLNVKRTRKISSFRISNLRVQQQQQNSSPEKIVDSILRSKRFSKRNNSKLLPTTDSDGEKRVVPTINSLDFGNDADEELSLSPNGPLILINEDMIDNKNIEIANSLNERIEASKNNCTSNTNTTNGIYIDRDGDDDENNNDNDDDDSELYFICSSSAKTAQTNFSLVSKSNCSVENGGGSTRVPLIQISARNNTLRQSDEEDVDESDDDNSEPELNIIHDDLDNDENEHNNNCTIQVKLKSQPNNNVNINYNNENSSHFHPEQLKASLLDMKHRDIGIVGGGHYQDSLSSDEDEKNSIWMEYGCL